MTATTFGLDFIWVMVGMGLGIVLVLIFLLIDAILKERVKR